MTTRVHLLALTVLLAACAGPTPGSSASPSPSTPPGSSPSAPPSTSPAPSAPPSDPADPGSLVGREFLSVRVTQGTEEIQLVDGTRISISFTADQIGIRAGCNIMGGSYVLDTDMLVANALSMTEMGCDPPRHAQDDWIATFISGRPTVALDGNDLVLTVGDTSITMIDREIAIPDLGLVGPTWTVDSIITGDAVSSVPMGVVASLVFGDDGSVAIQTGCNSGGGRYTVDAVTGTMAFSDIVITERACGGSEGQMEAAVLSVLQAAELTYALDAQSLQLMAGQIGLGLTGS